MSIFNASRLLGKTVLITGASAGIGAVRLLDTRTLIYRLSLTITPPFFRQATAILFAKGGSNLILLARRVDQLEKVAEAASAAHKASGVQQDVRIVTVQLDVSDRAQVAALWSKIPQELRNVDILVNNAGSAHGVDRVGDILDSDIDAMFATNVLGLISLTQLLVKERAFSPTRAIDFKDRNAGHVINLGSIAGRESYTGGGVYCATKAAVRAFTGSLLREVVNTPIRVTEIQPGMVETEFSTVRFRGDKSAADKVYDGLQPLTAEDIAEEIVWAATRPPHVNIAELYVLPVNQASPTLAFRGGSSK
ncbi:NAD-P-binding protein [Multifurca ochricompacta]|uniref:NAD-P-binding protein n=1 Tax=Multifurca ochricompacta TaxID=376703 RepID=A0AAD4MBK0_9AGAM|nr:NAD-P-binding protein [Multifurca ochricompacta]